MSVARAMLSLAQLGRVVNKTRPNRKWVGNVHGSERGINPSSEKTPMEFCLDMILVYDQQVGKEIAF